jgi:hypothetical protein
MENELKIKLENRIELLKAIYFFLLLKSYRNVGSHSSKFYVSTRVSFLAIKNAKRIMNYIRNQLNLNEKLGNKILVVREKDFYNKNLMYRDIFNENENQFKCNENNCDIICSYCRYILGKETVLLKNCKTKDTNLDKEKVLRFKTNSIDKFDTNLVFDEEYKLEFEPLCFRNRIRCKQCEKVIGRDLFSIEKENEEYFEIFYYQNDTKYYYIHFMESNFKINDTILEFKCMESDKTNYNIENLKELFKRNNYFIKFQNNISNLDRNERNEHVMHHLKGKLKFMNKEACFNKENENEEIEEILKNKGFDHFILQQYAFKKEREPNYNFLIKLLNNL